MRFRRLGKTGLTVSAIGLGTYQFGGSWGKDFTQREARDIIAAARDCGINLIDTAECYGVDHLSERLVGHGIASSRSHWILATKFGHIRRDRSHTTQSLDVPSVRQQLEESLRALGTDYVDLYQFHSGPNEDFENDDLWTMLNEQKRLGKIRFLGISVSRKKSEWRIYQTARASDVGADVIQVKYNRLERAAETEVLPECLKQDLGVMARVPLASGLLSGRYQNLRAFDPQDARAKKYDPELIAAMQVEIDDIIASELPEDATLPAYALAWSLSHEAVSCVIPGCKTVEHVRMNAAAGSSGLVPTPHPQDVP